MKKLSVQGSNGIYSAYIGHDIRFSLESYLEKKYSAILIITDEHVQDIYLSDITERLSHNHVYCVALPAGEQTKNIHQFYHLHTKALDFGLDRDSLIIAFGGGVVGDVAGFVAATFMRGIDYIQVPTTILAHDSSIGGKVAINHDYAKNIIGAFYPPTAVIYDTTTLNTLPAHEVRSGYAELVKEAFISDKEYLDTLLKTSLHHVSSEQIEDHLYKGMTVKSNIVGRDERDQGQRHFLNFGHTFGHALEAVLGLGTITHGEAVAIGMLFAIYVSEKTFNVKLSYTDLQNWMQHNGYPLSLNTVHPELIYQQMTYDKKTTHAHINMVLLQNIGEPVLYQFEAKTINNHIKSFSNFF